MRLSKKVFGGLVGQGNNVALKWPVARRHRVSAGKVVPLTSDARTTFPLLKADLFLSFANLGKNDVPSEKSVLAWVDRHGLLREKEMPSFRGLLIQPRQCLYPRPSRCGSSGPRFARLISSSFFTETSGLATRKPL